MRVHVRVNCLDIYKVPFIGYTGYTYLEITHLQIKSS